jgi:hypothetical protein
VYREKIFQTLQIQFGQVMWKNLDGPQAVPCGQVGCDLSYEIQDEF